jgi:hypothetical protein
MTVRQNPDMRRTTASKEERDRDRLTKPCARNLPIADLESSEMELLNSVKENAASVRIGRRRVEIHWLGRLDDQKT